MSQLYQLFCEGLLSRAGQFSSTFVVSSTPLEDENDANTKGVIIEQPVGEASQADKSVSSSMEPQVGSAEPDSPVDAIPQVTPQENAAALPNNHENPPPESPADEGLPSRPPSKTNGCSSVDFIDRLIAVENRDEVFQRKRCNNVRESSDESELNNQPSKAKVGKTNSKSDSSETDFEGAEEYYRKHGLPCLKPNQNSHESNEATTKKSPSLHLNEDESNMRLVMHRISTDSSSSSVSVLPNSQDLPDCTNKSFSAARCRVYDGKDIHSKPPNPQPDTCLESQQKQNNIENVHVVLTRLSPSNLEGLLQSKQSRMNVDSSEILKGVIAYVEVRSGHDNRSMGVRTQLRLLGATVLEKFNSRVTHVVFNEGSPTTLQNARKQGCHLVSVLWIDACKTSGQIVPEVDHPPLNLHLYDQPHFISKYRKMKSYQPDFEDGKSESKLDQYRKRFRRRAQPKVTSQDDRSSTEEQGEENCGNIDGSVPASNNKELQGNKPGSVILRPVSIVLNRIDGQNELAASSASYSSDKKKKRRLMPLQPHSSASLSFADLDLRERFRPECPYGKISSKPKTAPPLRKGSALVRSAVTQSQPAPSRRLRQLSTASQSCQRRSSCFVRGRNMLLGSQNHKKRPKPQMRTMVCTFMHRREIDVVAAVLKQLGGWILEPTVSPKTTHVVCGDGKRTINLLRGIAHGCWILHQEWVMRSLEVGHWLEEEPFELTVFPAIQQCRVARETLGLQPDIFGAVGGIFVANDTIPPRPDLLDLLQLCGGEIVKIARQAKVIVGQYQRRASHSDVTHVKEQWVLDSIQENMLQPFRPYRL